LVYPKMQNAPVITEASVQKIEVWA